MKTRNPIPLRTVLALLTGLSAAPAAVPLGTAFTYQGRLTDNGAPANGYYDLVFTAYDAACGATNVVSGPFTNSLVPMRNGFFTVTLDFGRCVFEGEARWLEIAARTNGLGAFATFPVRQPLTPIPYALYAPNAGTATTAVVANGVGTNALMGTNIAAGQVVKTLNGLYDTVTLSAGPNITLATNRNELQISAAVGGGAGWGLTGNSGTTGTNFLGTVDNLPLDFKVNGKRALRLEPSTLNAPPNLIGGSESNFVAEGVCGATIAGGGTVTGYGNAVLADFGVIGGGAGHTIDIYATSAVIGGGWGNWIQTNASSATISGGEGNRIENCWKTTIGGGKGNWIRSGAWSATIGGGEGNWIQAGASMATVGGGYYNAIQAGSANVSGGFHNRIETNAYGATIGGGGYNTIETDAYLAMIGGGEHNIICSNAIHASISGGYYNSIGTNAGQSTISGGELNGVIDDARHATIGGGWNNKAATLATVGGGSYNGATKDWATVSGGRDNAARNSYATVPGGNNNMADGQYSFAAGRRAKAQGDGSFVWADAVNADVFAYGANQFVVRATGGYWLFSGTDNSGYPTSGVVLPSGSGTWSNWSDRNAKTNCAPVAPRAVLEKVAALPIATWNYRTQDPSIRHIGPMAQDFQAAFSVGENDTTITTIDADGVALAAIQGLNQKLEQAVRDKEAKIAELEKRLAALEQLVLTQTREVNGEGL